MTSDLLTYKGRSIMVRVKLMKSDQSKQFMVEEKKLNERSSRRWAGVTSMGRHVGRSIKAVMVRGR